MRYAPRAILACGLGFAVSFVVACGGGSGLLSADQSNALSGQADQINSAVQAGNCGAASSASAVLNNAVRTLGATVNPTLRSNLTQGASTIAELAGKDCHQSTSTASAPTTTSSSTTTTTTSSTSTSTSTPTTTTTTTPTSATTPTQTGTTSTTGGAGLGGGTTTTTTTTSGNGTGGAGPGAGNTSGTGGGG